MESGHYLEEPDTENACRRWSVCVFLKFEILWLGEMIVVNMSWTALGYQSILSGFSLDAHEKLDNNASCPKKLTAFCGRRSDEREEICIWMGKASDQKEIGGLLPASRGNLSLRPGVLVRVVRTEITEMPEIPPWNVEIEQKLFRKAKRDWRDGLCMCVSVCQDQHSAVSQTTAKR